MAVAWPRLCVCTVGLLIIASQRLHHTISGRDGGWHHTISAPVVVASNREVGFEPHGLKHFVDGSCSQLTAAWLTYQLTCTAHVRQSEHAWNARQPSDDQRDDEQPHDAAPAQ
eukprot:180525-Chlamydomonas_euryale.AAC.8